MDMHILTLDDYIEAFRQVIESTWDVVASVDPYPENAYNGLPVAVSDWQQIQWEVLVEGHLRWTGQLAGYLLYYGEGMDEGMSMRYSEPGALTTHKVCCLPRQGDSLTELIDGKTIKFPMTGLSFGEFVGSDGWSRRPPYTHVLIRSDSAPATSPRMPRTQNPPEPNVPSPSGPGRVRVRGVLVHPGRARLSKELQNRVGAK